MPTGLMTPGLEGFVVSNVTFCFFDYSQNIGQILAVKSDFSFLPFYDGIDLTDILTQFFRFGGDGNFSRRQIPRPESLSNGRY